MLFITINDETALRTSSHLTECIFIMGEKVVSVPTVINLPYSAEAHLEVMVPWPLAPMP